MAEDSKIFFAWLAGVLDSQASTGVGLILGIDHQYYRPFDDTGVIMTLEVEANVVQAIYRQFPLGELVVEAPKTEPVHYGSSWSPMSYVVMDRHRGKWKLTERAAIAMFLCVQPYCRNPELVRMIDDLCNSFRNRSPRNAMVFKGLKREAEAHVRV